MRMLTRLNAQQRALDAFNAETLEIVTKQELVH